MSICLGSLLAAATLVLLPAGVVAQTAAGESEITAPGPNGPLAGTLLEPKAKAPVVLIIPGSGATDRDGNNSMGMIAAPLRLLAQGLAEQGVASVRIDKRGMFGSKAAVPDANKVTIADYAHDVHAWSDVIRKRTGQPCVWVLGHSEGGLVALAAAQQPAGICGVVLVSAAGRPIGEVIRAQLKANPANALILDQAFGAIDSLEAGKSVDTSGMNPAIAALFRPQVQPYVIDLFHYDPAKLIAAYKGPVLIVQGERDIQVEVADARTLKAAQPAAQLDLVPGMNHVLKSVASDDRTANLATYHDSSLPLAPGVVATIAQFVSGHAAN